MFSFKRFNTQFCILLGQNANRHGIALLVMVMYFVIIHFKFSPSLILTDRNPFDDFFMLLTIGSIGFSLDVFKQLRSPIAGIYYQMTPATVFEKWLAALLYTTLFTLVVIFTTFLLVHTLIITGANLFSTVDYAYQFPNWALAWENLKMVLFFQSLFFLGAVVFKKSPFLKTILVVVGSVILFSIIMGLVIKHQFDVDSLSVSFGTDKGMQGFEVLEQFETLIKVLNVFSWILPFGCWGAAWYRLKTIQH